jgi:hypothetical protein
MGEFRCRQACSLVGFKPLPRCIGNSHTIFVKSAETAINSATAWDNLSKPSYLGTDWPMRGVMGVTVSMWDRELSTSEIDLHIKCITLIKPVESHFNGLWVPRNVK